MKNICIAGTVANEIPGYPGYYATTDGRIYSCRTGELRRIASRLHKGYMHVNVRQGIGRSTFKKMPIHQLVLFAFHGEKPFESALCRHLNGNPLDNRLENLRWGTAKENIADSIRHGTAAFLRCGDDALASKLDSATVREIEQRARSGEKQIDIALDYGITQKHVSRIKLHQGWKHLWA